MHAIDETTVNRLGQTLLLGESARVAERIKAFNRECYWNAVRALRQCYRTHPHAVYVEGPAISSRFPIVADHGWLEVEGAIVDPTPSWHADVDPHDFDTMPRYFPAVRYTVADLRGGRLKAMPIIQRTRAWRAPDSPYMRATVDAWAVLMPAMPRSVLATFLTTGQLPGPLPPAATLTPQEIVTP